MTATRAARKVRSTSRLRRSSPPPLFPKSSATSRRSSLRATCSLRIRMATSSWTICAKVGVSGSTGMGMCEDDSSRPRPRTSGSDSPAPNARVVKRCAL
mgnify:FL=1